MGRLGFNVARCSSFAHVSGTEMFMMFMFNILIHLSGLWIFWCLSRSQHLSSMSARCRHTDPQTLPVSTSEIEWRVGQDQCTWEYESIHQNISKPYHFPSFSMVSILFHGLSILLFHSFPRCHGSRRNGTLPAAALQQSATEPRRGQRTTQVLGRQHPTAGHGRKTLLGAKNGTLNDVEISGDISGEIWYLYSCSML